MIPAAEQAACDTAVCLLYAFFSQGTLLVFFSYKFMNPLSCRFSGAHSQYYGSGSCYGVAAGKHAFLGGLSVILICDDTFPFIRIQTDSGGGD